VLAGDLNAVPGSREIEFLLARFSDAFAGTTAESRVPRVSERSGAGASDGRCIDYILLGQGAASAEARVLLEETEASDHRPIIVEVVLG
jgi:endonuclease/exonuclease/phosphatase family metal-dependent hydrolase